MYIMCSALLALTSILLCLHTMYLVVTHTSRNCTVYYIPHGPRNTLCLAFTSTIFHLLASAQPTDFLRKSSSRPVLACFRPPSDFRRHVCPRFHYTIHSKNLTMFVLDYLLSTSFMFQSVLYHDLIFYFKYASSAYSTVCLRPNGNHLVLPV